jgi:hypothetical protein
MAELETQKFTNRFTNEDILAVRFTGETYQVIDILNWVIDNGGRAQGDIRADDGLDLKVHERGVGLIQVKPGEYVIKTDAGFEIHPVLTFTQVYKKVSPVMTVIKKPIVLEAMQFVGGIENENELEEWLAQDNIVGTFRHSIPGTTVTFYRIGMTYGLIDVPLNNWIVKTGIDVSIYNEAEFAAVYQEVK